MSTQYRLEELAATRASQQELTRVDAWTATLAPHQGRTVAVELESTPQVTRVLAEAPRRTPASRPSSSEGERGKEAW